ncbi:uncharacterized protein [Miscanthus floridulus]|uniref:uncharacterized protein n=1 Tax=Miscanthus floridulus TaxID=154761 RepID=UPI0034578108
MAPAALDFLIDDHDLTAPPQLGARLVRAGTPPIVSVTPASPSVHGTVPVHGPVATPRHAPHSTEPQLLVLHSAAASAPVPQGAATSAPPSSRSWSHGPPSPGTAAPVPRAQAAASSASVPTELVRTAGSAAPVAPAQAVASGTGRTAATRPY